MNSAAVFISASNASLVGDMEHWLDVGCGSDKIAGAVGIDRIALPDVDFVHDLNQVPWPFADNSFDHIVCKHSLSHLDNLVQAMEEIHRIAKAGGVIEILVPHYTSDNFNTDPTHKFHMGYRSLNYFCDNVAFKYHYYSEARFEMVARLLSFRQSPTDFRTKVWANPYRWIGIEQLVNVIPRIYEHFFAYLLPASEVYFKLRVVKRS